MCEIFDLSYVIIELLSAPTAEVVETQLNVACSDRQGTLI